MSTIITRVGFCENCFKENNPKTNQLFLVFGSTSNKFKVYDANWNGVSGFTPHILRLKKVIGENVVYESACSLCDVEFWKNQEGGISFEITNWTRGILTLSQWNAWVAYKFDKDYFI